MIAALSDRNTELRKDHMRRFPVSYVPYRVDVAVEVERDVGGRRRHC